MTAPYLDVGQWILLLCGALLTGALARVYAFAAKTAKILDAMGQRNCPEDHRRLLRSLEHNSRALATATVYLKHCIRLQLVLIPDEDRERASRIQSELSDELARLRE